MLDLSLPSLTDATVFGESYQRIDQSEVARRSRFVKRLFDVLVSCLAIILIFSWLLPLIGLLIGLTSPGPVLFVQLRTGRNGRPFRCFKFRTMTFQRDAQFQQATKNDKRVTPLGGFLRKTNLDEMPQLLNVLRGDMSIVGPRPHPVPLDAQHWVTMAGYPGRYAVKPGITGLAQVQGCRGETAELVQMKHRLRYDKLYIRKQTLGLDLRICLQTVLNIVRGDEKAY